MRRGPLRALCRKRFKYEEMSQELKCFMFQLKPAGSQSILSLTLPAILLTSYATLTLRKESILYVPVLCHIGSPSYSLPAPFLTHCVSRNIIVPMSFSFKAMPPRS